MQDVLASRRDAKLEKLGPDDPKREELLAQYTLQTWLADAARRVSHIQAATHTIKAMHSDARGSSLYCQPDSLPDYSLVNSHVLGNRYAMDVVGNAAALDVNKFLTQEYQGKTLLAWMQDNEDVMLAAFNAENVDMARQWLQAFLGLLRNPENRATHTLAKQVYWLVGDNPCDDAQFHLLAPLYASSLAHSVYATIQEHRYGDKTKVAREAKKKGEFCGHPLHEYPNIAVQKLGGTKPQNISQLNTERKGVNYLLASCPPVWRSQSGRSPFNIPSVFKLFGRLRDVQALVRDLKSFLESDPTLNKSTRTYRAELVSLIVGELYQFAEGFRSLAPGWSADSRCHLAEEEQCWLDPLRAGLDAEFAETWLREDWQGEIKRRFGNWLNDALGGKLPLGDVEHAYWTAMFDDERWRRQIQADRHTIEKEGEHV
jgi:CRISPR-associated protein Csy1